MKMVINKSSVEVPDNFLKLRLLDYLRDVLGLMGTKYGCGQGLCGACTVHVDGVAARACQISLDELEGMEITTIEGLADTVTKTRLHPLQQAWIDHSVPQCGYCQAGQLMTAAAFVSENSEPSKLEIQEAMSGNLCRCGTYPRIEAAIAEVSRNLKNG